MTTTLVVYLVAEGIILGVLLRFNRTFGEYTETHRRVHESNLLVQQENLNIADRLAKMHHQSPIMVRPPKDPINTYTPPERKEA